MTQPSSLHVLALIPAYNEGARVAGVVRGARAYVPVLVVDDGSTDDTATHAESAGATVLHQTPNQGKGVALRAGFRYALEHGFDAVITLDADGQHDPDEIPAFLHAHGDLGSDLVIGERAFRQMPFPRNLSNTIGRWLFSWAVGQHVRDNQSGYRLLSRRMMEATLDSAEHGFEFEVEMIVTCIKRGYRLVGIPIRTIYGDETSHIDPLAQTVHFFRVVWQTRRAMARGLPAGERKRRRLAAWLPLLVLVLMIALCVFGAALLLATGSDDNDTQSEFAAQYPTPAPVTFIPPTPLPTTPAPTIPPPPEGVMDAPLPDFTLTTLDGKTLHLDELQGAIVLLNFWATWCAPCEAEMPLLQQVHATHATADPPVRVIGVTNPLEGQTQQLIEAFVARHDITFPVALSTDAALYSHFEVAQIPITYIIDRSGIVRFRHVGELHDHDIEDYLSALGE